MIDGLTCAQVEEYFIEAIKEGKTNKEDDEDTAPVGKKENDARKEMNELSEEDMLKERELFIINPKGAKMSEKVIITSTQKKTAKNSTNTDVKDEACNDNQPHCDHEMDDPTTPVSEMIGQSNTWQSTSVVGAMIGVGCLFVILTRAFKGNRS